MAIKDAERRKAAAIERDKAIDMQRAAILESPPPMGVGFQAIARSLDANGTHVPHHIEQVRQPDGRMGLTPIFGRHQFMDGEQLVEEVAQRVVQLIFQGAQAQMDAAGLPPGAEVEGEPAQTVAYDFGVISEDVGAPLPDEVAEPLWVPGA